MAEQTIPEPPDSAMILVGEPHAGVVLVRDDTAAAEGDYGSQHWQVIGKDVELPLSWAQVVGDEPDDGQLIGADRSVIQRVFTQAELDQAVADARRAAALTVVGDHLMEPGGYCRTHGSVHSPEELARAEDRLESEGVSR